MRIDLSPEKLEAIVLDCLRENYGLEASLCRLGGENLNFLVQTNSGERFVFKVVDDDMPPEVVAMEFRAIEHATSAGIQMDFPKIIESAYGKIETGITLHKNERYRARLLHFIEGKVFENCPDISINLLRNYGKALGGFDLAMHSFEDPAMYRTHRWDLTRAGRHRDKVNLIDDPEKHELLDWAFDTWEQGAQRCFPQLPKQFIHGDANRANVLVEGDNVVGLVDFGDSCYNPTICELGVCLAYIMMDQEDPIGAALTVARGYHDVRPLSALEQSVLLPLVLGRLAVTISVAARRRTIDPDHPNWFDSEKQAWKLIPLLRELKPEAFSFL